MREEAGAWPLSRAFLYAYFSARTQLLESRVLRRLPLSIRLYTWALAAAWRFHVGRYADVDDDPGQRGTLRGRLARLRPGATLAQLAADVALVRALHADILRNSTPAPPPHRLGRCHSAPT